MFTLTVRDRMMVAHSFHGEVFGPAQKLHGATYIVEATLCAEALDAYGVVADIGAVARALRAVLGELEYRNLDEEPAFAGVRTTTEVLAQEVANRLVQRIAAGELTEQVDRLIELEVTLRESDVARAGYRHHLPAATSERPRTAGRRR